MSKDLIYIIGDSYFQEHKNNWLERCFSKLNYDIVNLANGGESFWKQFDNLECLSEDKNFSNIKYCIVGWSDPCRPYIKGGSVNDSSIDFEYRRAVAILRYVNKILYSKYSHIKFINYFCFPYLPTFPAPKWGEQESYFTFDNQITCFPSMHDLTYKIYGEACQGKDNHLSDNQHEEMSNILYSTIVSQQRSGIVDLKKVTYEK